MSSPTGLAAGVGRDVRSCTTRAQHSDTITVVLIHAFPRRSVILLILLYRTYQYRFLGRYTLIKYEKGLTSTLTERVGTAVQHVGHRMRRPSSVAVNKCWGIIERVRVTNRTTEGRAAPVPQGSFERNKRRGRELAGRAAADKSRIWNWADETHRPEEYRQIQGAFATCSRISRAVQW